MVMIRDNFLVNSTVTKNLYIQMIEQLWELALTDENYAHCRYLTFPKPRFGEDASVSQKALFSIWAREIAAYALQIRPDHVHPVSVEEMKRTLKEKCYQEQQYSWLISKGVNPLNVNEVITVYTSSSDWKMGEAKLVLDFVQRYAASIGLVLESKGEHKKLTRRETA